MARKAVCGNDESADQVGARCHYEIEHHRLNHRP